MKKETQNDGNHILLITAAFPSASEPSRAVSVANAAALLARRLRVTVLAPRVYPADPCHEKLPGYEVVRFPYHSGAKPVKHYTHVPVLRLVSYLLSGLLAAMRLIRTNRIRLIYANWVLPAGLIGAGASLLSRIPLVVHAHGSDINVYARKNFFFNLLARFVLKRSKRVLAVGHDLLRTLTSLFDVPPGKTALSPPIVDATVFHRGPKNQTRLRLGLPLDAKLFLFVGDITASKGARLFFDAASQIAPAYPRALFLMLGEGPLRTALIHEARSRPGISLPGAVPNHKVADYMRAADILVLPSFSEGRPVSVLETAATGLPVLATRVGDLPEMVTDGENGILIEPGDRNELVRALRRILAEPGLLARLRKCASASRPGHGSPLPSIIAGSLGPTDYDKYWRGARASHFRRRARIRAGAAIAMLPARTGTVLDAGCGRGELLDALRACGLPAKGVDISSAAVEKVRHLGLEAEALDIEKDKIEGSFDAITCLEVLEHLEEPLTVLKKLARSVRPGGHIIVSLPNEGNFYHGIKNFFAPNPAHLHRFNHGKALELFESAGLLVRRRRPLPLLSRWPGLRLLGEALCRLWPGAFAVSNMYLLWAGDGEVDER